MSSANLQPQVVIFPKNSPLCLWYKTVQFAPASVSAPAPAVSDPVSAPASAVSDPVSYPDHAPLSGPAPAQRCIKLKK